MSNRIVEGRPVLSREEMTSLAKRLFDMTQYKTSDVFITHKMHATTRFANGNILTSDDGDYVDIKFVRKTFESISVSVRTNQLTDDTLRRIAKRFDEVQRDWKDSESIMPPKRPVQDDFVQVHLWHDSSVQAMRDTAETVLPKITGAVSREGLQASGYIGFLAKSEAVFTHDNTSAYSEETDCEVTVTARTPDGKCSGWGGQAARQWGRIDTDAVVARSVETCKRAIGAQALEPGRRTVILTPDAAAQMMRYLAYEFDAEDTVHRHITPFYSPTHPGGARYGERMFDPRITMRSDPADPEGGYRPYFWFGFANSPTTWVQNGVLKELAWSPYQAAGRGRTSYADLPYSMRISGGDMTIEEMIASCHEGVFINQLTDVDLLSLKTGVMTGVTRDGCFLIKNGKITRALKNFRFVDSPFFMLNNVVALGRTQRAAFGFTPPSGYEMTRIPPEWPRPPIIVPPMMIKDFNLVSLADAL